MGKHKRIAIMMVLLLFVGILSGCQAKEPAISAEGETITQEFDFESVGDYTEEEFPEEITVNGQTYRITGYSDIQYETTETKEVVQKEVEISVENESDIQKKKEFEIAGKTYALDLVESDYAPATIRVTKTTSVDYTAKTTEPTDVPATAEIITMRDGQEVELEGKLKEVKQVSDYEWTNDFVITGIWEGTPGASNYTLQGAQITVPYNASSPTWDGWKTDLLKASGLSSSHYRFDSAEWAGNATAGGLGTQRRAYYYGSRNVADFIATYETSYETEGFAGTATYRIDADKTDAPQNERVNVYKVHAIVKYQLVEAAENE